MALNPFEKYGIKDVANVTLFRIERKDETYESHREISASSILKSALTKELVYPLDEEGRGSDEGYEAWVFKKADVLTHFNYDCDDVINVKGSAIYVDRTDPPEILGSYSPSNPNLTPEDLATLKDFLVDSTTTTPALFTDVNSTVTSLIETQSNRDYLGRLATLLSNGYTIKMTATDITDITYKGVTASTDSSESVVTKMERFRCYFVTDGSTFDSITFSALKTKLVNDFPGMFSLGDEYTDTDIEDITEFGTNPYIEYELPAGISPAAAVVKFNALHMDFYNSLGIVTRFTQPVRVGQSESEEGTFSGTLVIKGSVDISQEETDVPFRVTYTFTNANLDTATLALLEVVHMSTISYSQMVTLHNLVDDSTVTELVEFISSFDDLNDTTRATAVLSGNAFTVFKINFVATLEKDEELETGRWGVDEGDTISVGHQKMDADLEIGTHEYSYAEQICMLFAKNQNLITKAGTRYQFADPDALFGSFEFNDNFASAPNSTERVVVVGLPGLLSENLYSVDDVNSEIKNLTDTFKAKAYDITYSDYAELVVEDEMGYYVPQQLGAAYDKKLGKVTFFNDIANYETWAENRRGVDVGIAGCTETWGDGVHYSINDAIDALKQEQKTLDTASEYSEHGFDRVFGGYLVRGKSIQTKTLPLDDLRAGGAGSYDDWSINGTKLSVSSLYSLEDVINKMALVDAGSERGQLRITSTIETESNRAIYVNPEDGLLAGRANIYLLKNVNIRTLTSDQAGIFEFNDKKGNKLYYQDKIFAGTAYLALVAIGKYGLIFVVDRHCNKVFTQTAWMLNDNGYLTDKQAIRIVKNGLIHTVTVTDCNESFDATCTVKAIKVRKTKKNALHYIPVLFLDTLKVSTLEQASEKADATGGQGNAKLITWDYGKEITLSLEDALYTPASMAAIWAGEHGDLENGVKDTTMIDRMEKITAKRSFIVPAGNQEGTPSEGDVNAQAVYYDPKTMKPFQDGTPIAEGEVVYKFTRSVAYEGNSIGNTIEISAEKFPGTYRVIGETLVRDKATGEDQRFQFIIPEAKMSAEDTSITLEADGDPTVFSFSMDVLRPDNGIMMKIVQFDVVENEEENDGSTMVKDTENLNLLDDAEMYKVGASDDEEFIIGATEY